MVQESEIISFCVNRIEMAHDALGLPATKISLNNLSLSCHKNTTEQDLENLVSRMEGYLREIILEAYHQSSERISN
jgi:hypothetical protein